MMLDALTEPAGVARIRSQLLAGGQLDAPAGCYQRRFRLVLNARLGRSMRIGRWGSVWPKSRLGWLLPAGLVRA